MQINKKLIKYNFTPNANTPEYIVIHDTGNRSVGATAEMHYQYFNGADRNSSAHFFVDDKQVLQIIEIKDKSYHCGDGQNKYGIGNGNSISIEICINKDNNFDITVAKTIELTKYLMKKYNISIDKVVRHYDASRKNCPQSFNNNGDWSKWFDFKNKLVETKIEAKIDEAFKQNLEILKSYNQINTIEYWLLNAVEGKTVKGEYAQIILNKLADTFKNKPPY